MTAHTVIPYGLNPVELKFTKSKYQVAISAMPRKTTMVMKFWSCRMSRQNRTYWRNQRRPRMRYA